MCWGRELGCPKRFGEHLPPWHLIANLASSPEDFPGFLEGEEPSYLFQAPTFTRQQNRKGDARVLTDKHGREVASSRCAATVRAAR